MNLRNAFDAPVPTVVLAEGEFGKTGGKTANGVVTHSEVFDVRAVVDSTTKSQTAADVLRKPGVPDVPVVESVSAALDIAPDAEALVIGVAPAGGQLPDPWVDEIEDALRAGCDVVSGLHVFLGDDDEWASLAAAHNARIFDVRKPPAEETLRVGDGSVDDVDADVVLTLGTDCAVGKRTTTFELYRAAREAGLNAGWVATGQTGIMVGAHAGVVIDRVPADFTAGVVEDLVASVAADADSGVAQKASGVLAAPVTDPSNYPNDELRVIVESERELVGENRIAVVKYGVILENADEDWGFVPGEPVYLASGGGFTQTAPSGGGDLVQIVGEATDDGEALFLDVETGYEVA